VSCNDQMEFQPRCVQVMADLGRLAWHLVPRARRDLVHQHRRDLPSAPLLLAQLQRRRVLLAQVLHFQTDNKAVLAQICTRLVRSSPHKLCHPFGQWSEHPDGPRHRCLVSSRREGHPGLCHQCLVNRCSSRMGIGLREEGRHGLCHLCLANSSLCCRLLRNCLLLVQAQRGNSNRHPQLPGCRASQEARALSLPACRDSHLRSVMRGSVALHGRGLCLHSHKRSRCPIA